jgi:hypothetical protein
MRHALVALLLLGTAPAAAEPQFAPIGTLRRAVQSFYAQNNRVQLAVWRDACLHWDLFEETRTARSRLRRSRDRANYDLVSKRLGAAYQSTEMTDGELEGMNADFCDAADNR